MAQAWPQMMRQALVRVRQPLQAELPAWAWVPARAGIRTHHSQAQARLAAQMQERKALGQVWCRMGQY